MKTLHFALLTLALAAATAGCARPIRTGAIPVDSRPDLTAPDAAAVDTLAVPGPGRTAPAAETPLPDTALESLRARVEADTLAARAAVRRCSGRRLLPEQESSHDATIALLAQARAALVKEDLRRAESLARQARQMSATLDCP